VFCAFVMLLNQDALCEYIFLPSNVLSSSYTESFLAAARELQRICGKDEVKQLL
jgi:hypothetical protein